MTDDPCNQHRTPRTVLVFRRPYRLRTVGQREITTSLATLKSDAHILATCCSASLINIEDKGYVV